MPHDGPKCYNTGVTDNLAIAFSVLDLTGVVLNGILGGVLARQRRFDAVGFGVLAIVSALGGGVLRDVLLQSGRPIALTNPWYLPGALAGAFIAFLVPLDRRGWQRLYPVIDALVMGTWAATGATRSLAVGLDPTPAVLLGITTAVGGGIIRDVAVGQVPSVFTPGSALYATSALVAATTMVALEGSGFPPQYAMLVATVVGAMLALISKWRQWRLPTDAGDAVTMTRGQVRALIRRTERSVLRRIRLRDVRPGRRREVDPGSAADDPGPM